MSKEEENDDDVIDYHDDVNDADYYEDVNDEDYHGAVNEDEMKPECQEQHVVQDKALARVLPPHCPGGTPDPES